MKAYNKETVSELVSLLERTVEKKHFCVTEEFKAAARELASEYGYAPEIKAALIENLDKMWERAPQKAREMTVSTIGDARKAGYAALEGALVVLWSHMLTQDQQTSKSTRLQEISLISRNQPGTALSAKAQELYLSISR